jgi:UDP-N-acetylmuramoylalanine--D-glutamate ligase
MPELNHKSVAVLGLGQRGQAACRLLLQAGARVVALDTADTPALRAAAAELTGLGVRVELGCSGAPVCNRPGAMSPPSRLQTGAPLGVPADPFDLAVLSPGVSPASALAQEFRQRGVPLMGELELGCQRARCLTLALAGTNGKATTARMIAAMLARENRHAVICGHQGHPICAALAESNELDYLVLIASAFQLETTTLFRPSVAVVTNLAPDCLDRYASFEAYCRAVARVFANQQPFDWAIVQAEALATLSQLGLAPRGKVVTFSAADREADLWFDRGLLLSRVPGWEGPLLDTANCALRGPHNAENFMAALAVGRALRLSLESGVTVLRDLTPAPHCGELIAEHRGVQFINDSKATNPHAMQQAIGAIPPVPAGLPNVWLIAGGRDKGLDFHNAAPLVSRRVKGAFLLGEARELLRSAWGLFTPCRLVNSLAEAVAEAAQSAVPGDVVLLSPACSSYDQFRDYQHRGDVFREAVHAICKGDNESDPV